MKHCYRADCNCARCTREYARRASQADHDRPIAAVMADWAGSRNRRRARTAREYWAAYDAGTPMSDDDR